MKLYINTLSPNVRRVRLVVAATGIELEETTLDFAKGEHKAPAYLALNPNGAVPTLVDGDLAYQAFKPRRDLFKRFLNESLRGPPAAGLARPAPETHIGPGHGWCERAG